MLGLILARGGSKGLPGKNIKELNGLPLIAYTIKAALASGRIDRLVLSTDDEKIAEVGRSYGADVPFMRPAELGADKTPSKDVIVYTIDTLMRSSGQKIKEFMLLQPTSPLRTSQDIISALNLFRDKQADAVISVSEGHHPPAWAKRVLPDGRLANYNVPQIEVLNRQDAAKVFYPNGAIYVFNYDYYRSVDDCYSGKVYAYQMPKERSVDIDDLFDFKLAEHLLNG